LPGCEVVLFKIESTLTTEKEC